VVNLSTGQEVALAAGPDSDSQPLWMPDGRAVVFAKQSSGRSFIMVQPFGEGEPIAPPIAAQALGNDVWTMHGLAPDGSLYVLLRQLPLTAYRTSLDLSAGTVGQPFAIEPNVVLATTGAARSVLGSIAYLRGTLNGMGASLVVRDGNGNTTLERRFGARLRDRSQVRWSPDGQSLIIGLGERANDENANSSLWLLHETSEPRDVVAGRGMFWPNWDPTGQGLYYLSGNGLRHIDLDLGTQAEPAYLVRRQFLRIPAGFDVSPADGRLVVAAFFLPDMTPTMSTGCVVRVAEPFGSYVDGAFVEESCWALAWSQDGEHILLSTTDNDGIGKLWRLDRNGRNRVMLSDDLGHILNMSVSPDGTELLFSAERDEQARFIRLTGLRSR
jgi:Tol biopolymer transport system component